MWVKFGLINGLVLFGLIRDINSGPTKQRKKPFSCPDVGFFENPINCRSYFHCERLESSGKVVAHKHTCSTKKVFSKIHNETCVERNLSNRPECMNNVNNKKLNNTVLFPIVYETEVKVDRIIGVENETSCKEAGFMLDINNCQKFHVCTKNGTDNYSRQTFSCPPNTMWEPKKNWCVLESEVSRSECKKINTTDTSNTGKLNKCTGKNCKKIKKNKTLKSYKKKSKMNVTGEPQEFKLNENRSIWLNSTENGTKNQSDNNSSNIKFLYVTEPNIRQQIESTKSSEEFENKHYKYPINFELLQQIEEDVSTSIESIESPEKNEPDPDKYLNSTKTLGTVEPNVTESITSIDHILEIKNDLDNNLISNTLQQKVESDINDQTNSIERSTEFLNNSPEVNEKVTEFSPEVDENVTEFLPEVDDNVTEFPPKVDENVTEFSTGVDESVTEFTESPRYDEDINTSILYSPSSTEFSSSTAFPEQLAYDFTELHQEHIPFDEERLHALYFRHFPQLLSSVN